MKNGTSSAVYIQGFFWSANRHFVRVHAHAPSAEDQRPGQIVVKLGSQETAAPLSE